MSPLQEAIDAVMAHQWHGPLEQLAALERLVTEARRVAQPAEPVAWAQLGMRNGHTYVRMHYEGPVYPPPKDVQRNLNLVPLYTAPPAPQPAGRALPTAEGKPHAVYVNGYGYVDVKAVRAIERAHGIKSEGE